MRFLTVCNSGYTPLTKNLLANFYKPWMLPHTLTVQCLDAQSYHDLLPQKCSRITILRAETSRALPTFFAYGTPGFTHVTRQKILLLREFLETYSSADGGLWYIDSDVAILKDPQLHVPEGDFVFQSDEPKTKDQYGINQCSGNMFIKPTARTLFFLKFWLLHMDQHRDYNDQESLVDLFKELRIKDIRNFSTCTLNSFDMRAFPNGHLAFHEKIPLETAVMIHANFLIGMKQKIDALKSHGGWFT